MEKSIVAQSKNCAGSQMYLLVVNSMILENLKNLSAANKVLGLCQNDKETIRQ